MPNVPQEIESNSIDFQIKLMRLEASTRNKIVRILDDLAAEMKSTLEGIDPTLPKASVYRKQRIEKVIAEVESLTKESYKEAYKTLQADLIDVADFTDEQVRKMVNEVIGVDIVSQSVNLAQIKELVKNSLIEGAPSKDWWGKQASDLVHRFSQEIRKGMAANETITDMVRRIRGYSPRGAPYVPGIMDISTRNAEALVRTSVMTISNTVRMDLYKANDNVVRGLQWVSTLDSRTTLICRSLDGLTWDLELNPIGHKQPYPGPIAHWGCRSTTVPLLKKWSDMLDDKELAKKLDRLELDSGTRASMGGQVDKSTNYESWLRTRTQQEQIDILGKGRYELWSKGQLPFSRMIDQSNNPRTLKEIRGPK